MKQGIYSLVALLALALFSNGCAHVIEFRVPQEFKDKKQVEDPPLTKLPVSFKEAIG